MFFSAPYRVSPCNFPCLQLYYNSRQEKSIPELWRILYICVIIFCRALLQDPFRNVGRRDVVVFTSISSTPGETNAGRVGPRKIFFIPRYKSVSSMQTAFCSYHDRTSVSGRSFTEQPKASASASAILIALYASLHCPQSSILGMPSIVPRSRSFIRYFPQASVRISVSGGVALQNPCSSFCSDLRRHSRR